MGLGRWALGIGCWVLGIAFSQTAKLDYTVRAGSEGSALIGALRSRVEGGARLIGANGQASYRFRMLSGMQVRLSLTSGGTGSLKVVSGGTVVFSRALSGKIQTQAFTFRVPNEPSVQALTLTFSTTRRQRLYFYGLTLAATDHDLDRDGIGDAVERLLGASAGALKVNQSPALRTTFQTGSGYDPRYDLQTDAVLVYSDEAAKIESWKRAGYFIQTMGGFRDYQSYVNEHPNAVQTDQNGEPLHIAGSYYLTPTEERFTIVRDYYRRALAAGSSAVCPEEPEYWANAGYEEAFKTLWQAQYHSSWKPPHESAATRWQSDRLKAHLMTKMVHDLLWDASVQNPQARRMTAVHSPLNYPLWRICFAHAQALLHPLVQEVIGQVWSDTVRTEVPLNGNWREEPFAQAYLEYASFLGLLRGTDKTTWFLMDPLADMPNLGIDAYKRYYAATLTAATLFPEVKRFEVLPWPDRIFGKVPSEYATTILNVARALESIAQQNSSSLDAGSQELGTFFSDTMAYQRSEPEPSRFENLWGLTLPFVKRGVPIQMLSLDRAKEGTYLNRTRILLLSYDYLKPVDAGIHEALANWVRTGGWLVVFGGTDAYNDVPDAWWKAQGVQTPTEALLKTLGLTVKTESRLSQPAPSSAWQEVAKHGTDHVHGDQNRRWLEIDLSAYAQNGQTVYLRFADPLPDDGWGPLLRQVRLQVDGRVEAAFYAGNDIERMFLYDDHGSRLNIHGRFADGHNFFVYRISLPKAGVAKLSVELSQEWQVLLSVVAPYEERLIEPARNDLPRLRLRDDEAITIYQVQDAETLYTWQGQPVGIARVIGRGGVVVLGVPSRVFALYPSGDEQIRKLVQHVYGRSGLRYRERARIMVQRGDWVAAYSTYRANTLRGVFLEVMEPNLSLVRDPVLAPNEACLLLKVQNDLKELNLLHTSARIVLQYQTPNRLAYLLKGPAGTPGALRVSTGGRRVEVEAFDSNGNPVPVNVERNRISALVRWNMTPEGTVLVVSQP